MSKRRVLFLVPFILASIFSAAIHPRIAAAIDGHGPYDIEGSASWCAKGATNCSPTVGEGWDINIDVDGPINEQPSGTPSDAFLGCVHDYTAGGARVRDRASVNTSSAISGTGSIFGNDLLEDPNAAQWGTLSNVTAIGPDGHYPSTTVTAHAFGTALINSDASTLISGGFRVTVSPYIHEVLDPNTGSPISHSVVYGTLACADPNHTVMDLSENDFDASFDFRNIPAP